jgi:excisionase family DNA binding protein
MSIDKKSRKTKRPQHQANREDQRATGYGRRGEAQVGMGELLTVKEVAAKLKVSRPTVYTFIGLGLRFIKLGERSLRFRPSEVERFVKTMEQKTK